jgi:hypothetical protein
MEELNNSEYIYRNPDGSPKVALQIRNRLSVSVLMEGAWWHHELETNNLYKNNGVGLLLPGEMNPVGSNDPESVIQQLLINDDWLADTSWFDFNTHQ